MNEIKFLYSTGAARGRKWAWLRKRGRGITFLLHARPEEVGHDFRGMLILLMRTICNVHVLLTQWVDLGSGGV